jgi:hypothetical protein
MSELALAKPQHVQNTPKPAKRERISPRFKRAIDALVTGEAKTQIEAARIAQISREHFSRHLSKPHIQAFYERRTREIIRGAQMRAAAKVSQLIEAQSEHVASDTAFKVLAINGIKPADSQAVVNVNVSPGYVIDLGADPRTIEPDK